MKIKTVKIELNRKELIALINLINNNVYDIKEPRDKIVLSDVASKLCRGVHVISIQSIELKNGENDDNET